MRLGHLGKALRIASIVAACLVAAILVLVVARFGSTAPPTSVMEAATPGAAAASSPDRGPGTPTRTGVSLPELVYFGAAWQMLNRDVGLPPIVLGGGFANARVERTGDGKFFAGTVERLDRRGNVTDVVLAFAGAQGSGDFIQGEALAYGRVLGEPKWAAVLLERVWHDPRYASAHIHVTGHSLGAGYAQFAGTEAIARHGIQAVSSRIDIVAFGTPNWGPQSARYFHVSPHVLDGSFTAYTALNDPVITNGGTARVGVSHFLPAFNGLSGVRSLFNRIAAHWPTTYMSALGLPDWLTEEQKASCIGRVSKLFITGNSYDPRYGAAKHTQ
jgi:hypothetical protein